MSEDYSKILNHIHDIETKKTIGKFIDSLLVVKEKGITYCSDFLNPREISYCVKSIETFNKIDYKIIPNEENCERNCILIDGETYISNETEYINYITCKNDFSANHRDILGAILGLGISRSKVGDILITESDIFIVIRKSITNYILANLNKIGRNNVEFKLVDIIPFEEVKENQKEYSATVSSLRMDVVLSEIIHLSRSKVSEVIKRGKVKINHEELKKTHIELSPQDIISVRGYGRYKFTEVLGKTKKDKFRIKYIEFK